MAAGIPTCISDPISGDRLTQLIGMIQLSGTFDKTLQQLTYANGATLINQGIWNCAWMPFAVKYALASTENYTIFIVGRAFQGTFEAPIESVVPSTTIDMLFLHNRVELVAIYGLAALGGN
ncbi:hypothetical protein N7532_006398 [Penicillium argentinense]|uniref:Uncharacterized protein n=1 Tax=Penicillium argentinense TaxID=1131581 RepID=A0A9W9FG73_9EURO|nr:uncharacterized protein N7532_006398 [Penicillium argentinense]KAJ5099397.1 hypothetical protein N7532_006398 [Penicillium argentinense]